MTYAEAMAQEAVVYLRGVLAQSGGIAGPAAKLAGVNRTHFYKLLKRHGLKFTPVPRTAAPPRNKTSRRVGARHPISVSA